MTNEKIAFDSDLKNTLPPGPWQNEPDRVEFEHDGFPCLVNRNWLGVWCGYVAVTENHPFYQKEYGEIDSVINVHGGLTYSAACNGKICHIPKEGETDKVWWLGFDCGHGFDVTPYERKKLNPIHEMIFEVADLFSGNSASGDVEYRDLYYVTEQTKFLATQLSAINKFEKAAN